MPDLMVELGPANLTAGELSLRLSITPALLLESCKASAGYTFPRPGSGKHHVLFMDLPEVKCRRDL
jgi:hypothetical protein